jgi:hypothetical protein
LLCGLSLGCGGDDLDWNNLIAEIAGVDVEVAARSVVVVGHEPFLWSFGRLFDKPASILNEALLA